MLNLGKAVLQRSRALRVLGFVIVPMMSIASPLLAIPAITSHFGATGWSAVAIGQSIGASLAVIGELGWGLTGPQRVARQSQRLRRQTLALALFTKTIVLLPLVVIAGVISFYLAQDFRWESATVAVGSAAYGINSTWYFIGTGSSARLLVTDAIPRLLCVSASALLIFSGGVLALYPVIGVVLPTVISTLLVTRMERISPVHLRGMTPGRLVLIFRSQSVALAGRSLSAIYMSLPVTLVSIVSPSTVAVFSAIERLQRIYLQVLSAIPNIMQNRVGQSTRYEQKYRRAINSIYLNGALGITTGLIFTLLVPIMAKVVFASTIKIPLEFAALSGIMIFAVCTSRASGSIALVALGRVRSVLASAAAGAGVGIPTILLGAYFLGTPGALAGEILAELVVLSSQIRSIRKYRP